MFEAAAAPMAPSPFYTPEHEAFRRTVRRFVDREIMAHVDGWDEAEEFPRDLYRKASAAGLLQLGFPEEYGGVPADPFFAVIKAEELARHGSGGVNASLNSHTIGCPPIAALGPEWMKRKVLPEVLAGEKISALAITEPSGGSDVANLRTTAKREGDHYVVNGSKMFITSGVRADYFTVAVRTGDAGAGGVSLLLIEREREGFARTKLKKMGWWASDTAQLFFDNVKVPVENRIGEENAGWTVAKYLLEFERGGDPYSAGLIKAIESLRHMAAQEHASDGTRLADDPYFQRRMAEAEIDVMALEYAEKRIMAALSNGQNPGAASSMMKIRGSETLQKLTEIAIEAIGYYAQPFEPQARAAGRNVQPIVPEYAITTTPQYFNHRASSIYAGSNEIQRNILAKQMLGL